MRKTIAIVLCLLLSFPFFARAIYAQTTTDYIWQYQTINNLTNASDLSNRLELEVTKVIAAGHLAPFRTLYGEGASTNGQYAWYHRYDVVYTLSVAYPYLSASLQAQVKSYLQSEMQTFPLWDETYLDPKVGTKREPDTLTTTDRSMPNYASRPKLFALYALWLYAQNTNDWSYISNNWSQVTAFYNRNSSEVGKYYSSIAGAIGLARMAQQKGTVDTTVKNAAVTAATNGLTAGKNYTTFSTNAETAYTYSSGERWDYTRRGSYMGFQFLDITPEIGRYFAEDSSLKATLLGQSGTSDYTVNTAERKYSLWYMAQAPYGVVMYGEGAGTHPELRAMLFPIHAWVLRENAGQLRSYVDVPDALLGDFYYMQNLARTIEAHGQACWKDVLTSVTSCGPNPSLTPQPTPSASPTALPGDVNSDGVVNAQDLKLVLTNFGKTPGTVTGYTDPVADNKVNMLDAAWVIGQWGR